MPPKESKKAQRSRERQERHQQQQHAARVAFEVDEDRARRTTETAARHARNDVLLRFYEVLMDPSARLMVPSSVFDQLRGRMLTEGELAAGRVASMQAEVRAQRQQAAALHAELVHLRREARLLTAASHQRLGDLRDAVDRRVEDFVGGVAASIAGDRALVAECGQHLNAALEEARVGHIAVASEARGRAAGITALWQQHTSMHTRIPARIRRELSRLEVDGLLHILDVLSFDDAAREHLLFRFGPGPDCPFAAAPRPASAALTAAAVAATAGDAPAVGDDAQGDVPGQAAADSVAGKSGSITAAGGGVSGIRALAADTAPC